MPLPTELVGAMPLPVSGSYRSFGRNQISFGTWSTARAHEGLVWGFGPRMLGDDASQEIQPYEIALASGQRTLQAECYAQALGFTGEPVAAPRVGLAPLACAFTGSGDGTLRLQGSAAASAASGAITFADSKWTIKSVHRSEASSTDGLQGYEISREGKVIAAVQTAKPSQVWLGPQLSAPDQDRVALILTALLLYQPLEQQTLSEQLR